MGVQKSGTEPRPFMQRYEIICAVGNSDSTRAKCGEMTGMCFSKLYIDYGGHTDILAVSPYHI